MTLFKSVLSPFFGGGSFEFFLQNNYNYNIIANDKFTPLYNFWLNCKTAKSELCAELYDCIGDVNKETFQSFREAIMDKTGMAQAKMYFIINRCSFSGATLSGGFSKESSEKRFTRSSINRIEGLNLEKFNISNLDFEEFLNNALSSPNSPNSLIFLDPPYYLEKQSKLYGNNGDMHENFDHDKLYNTIHIKNNWIMTYNNCDYIKNLYQNFDILETSWSCHCNR